ncbi:MAG TPA: serine/threonine-protein kinase [Pyrinomonadaceae bacterium]|nr:serine/threonine-protein kinase [Pyrinomonadaceae bacterium]
MSTPEENKSTAANFLLTPETILQSRYRIVSHLGKGGMGAVYEAIDLRLGHTVALKQTLTSDEELWKQFEREARLMARLNHPVLPGVSDYFTEGHRAFLVMQYVEGADLANIIAQQPGPFPRQAVIAWADQLLDALIYLHSRERQIIHRDIKPHNLKVTPSGQIALLDFGLAKTQVEAAGEVSCTSVFGYTPRYAPIEQIQDMGTGPQSDIYALGATLYHLLTGIKPTDALTRAAALVSSRPSPLKPANEVNSAISPELAKVITRAMAQNPNERYATAVEFREALRCVGRTDELAESDFVARTAPFESTIVEIADTTFVRPSPGGATTRKLDPPAIAALFVILIAAFGVFCRYYPWKLPPSPAPESSYANVAVRRPVTVSAQHDQGRSSRTRKQKSSGRESFKEISQADWRTQKAARRS